MKLLSFELISSSVDSREKMRSSRVLEEQSRVRSRVEIVLKRSFLASTVGRVLGMLQYKDDSSRLSRKEVVEFVQKRVAQIPLSVPLRVNIGGTSAVEQTRRFFRQRKDSLGFFARVFYAPRVFFGKVFEKLSRQSNYDLNTNTVTIYRPTKACVLHELGHVAASQKSGNPEAYFSLNSDHDIYCQEIEANQEALKLAKNAAEQSDVAQTLSRIERSYARAFGISF